MTEAPFGHLARQTSQASELLGLEISWSLDQAFASIDVVVAGIMIRAIRGERVVAFGGAGRGDKLAIVGIPDELRAVLPGAFQLEAQQARGAWFLPETATIRARSLLWPTLFRQAPRYGHLLAAGETGSVSLVGSTDAMVAWAVLEPFADALLAPIFMRVEKSGTLSREEFAARWLGIANNLADLGLSLADELQPFEWAGGWAQLSADGLIAIKGRLLDALAAQVSVDVVRRYRASATRRLVEQYYAKAKNGCAKRRQVVTKDHARTLAAFFGGDWLAFIRYLGEKPHEEERIATALPKSKLIVAGRSKAEEIAAKRSLPVEEVERILGTFWQGSANSPVLDRVDVLKEHWRQLDAIHARQVPGMLPLWGLVEEGGWAVLGSPSESPHQGALYRQLLPAELVARIDRLWGTTVLTKYPACVVSEPFPHSAMADAFGPALRFWHGCSLTAWFVCEGPSSRTDIPGMEEYYERELLEMRDGGCPVHPGLFTELAAVRLGPEEPTDTRESVLNPGQGLPIVLQISSGSRRKGFSRLRDVITRHRRGWAAQHLETYLRGRWEVELKATARRFHLLTEERGKPPTLKQFAKHCVEPSRRWFGGDVQLLYGCIGEKFTGVCGHPALQMPEDRVGFVDAVFACLDRTPVPSLVASGPERQQASGHERQHQLRRLAAESLSFVQLLEALGRPPSLKEFGPKFSWPGTALAGDIDVAWTTYAAAVCDVLRGRG